MNKVLISDIWRLKPNDGSLRNWDCTKISNPLLAKMANAIQRTIWHKTVFYRGRHCCWRSNAGADISRFTRYRYRLFCLNINPTMAFVWFVNCGLKGALVLFFNWKGETVWLDHLRWIYEAHIGGESTILGLTLLDCELFPSIHPWEITLFVMATIAFAAISSSSLSRTLLSLPFITACSQPNIQKKHCCQDCKIDSFSVSKSTYYEFTESFHKLLLTSEVEKATRSRIWNAVLQKRQSGSIFWIQHQSWEVWGHSKN